MFSGSCQRVSPIPRPAGLALPVAGMAALLRALGSGDNDGALRLLSSWPPHDMAFRQFRTEAGETLLHFAAYGRSSPEVMDMLLARGIDLRAATRSGASALHYAMYGAMRASPAAVQWLLREGGPALREMADTNGRTALMAAVLADAGEAATALLAGGACVRTRDNFGYTALHLAAAVGSPGLVEALLRAGAPADERNKAGITPLMIAAREGRRDNVPYLLVAGVDIDAADGRGGTPLMYAVANGHVEIAELLLTGDAAWHLSNDEGWNAMTLAAHTGNAEMLQVLVDHGANPDVEDGAGRLPWRVAVQRSLAQLTGTQRRQSADGPR